jgi:hypothetical protein
MIETILFVYLGVAALFLSSNLFFSRKWPEKDRGKPVRTSLKVLGIVLCWPLIMPFATAVGLMGGIGLLMEGRGNTVLNWIDEHWPGNR